MTLQSSFSTVTDGVEYVPFDDTLRCKRCKKSGMVVKFIPDYSKHEKDWRRWVSDDGNDHHCNRQDVNIIRDVQFTALKVQP